MQLNFDSSIISNYRSNSQKARILTENWVSSNMFCSRCGNSCVEHFENNRPVADFYCSKCHSKYELKSKSGTLEYKSNFKSNIHIERYINLKIYYHNNTLKIIMWSLKLDNNYNFWEIKDLLTFLVTEYIGKTFSVGYIYEKIYYCNKLNVSHRIWC